MRFVLACQVLVGVGGGNQYDRVKAGGIEGDHRRREQNENHRGERKRADDGSDCGIEVAAGGIKSHDIQFSEHLESQAVVSEDNKAHKRAAKPEHVAAEDCLPDRTSTRDGSNEERGSDAPDHPVCPVEHCPCLRK